MADNENNEVESEEEFFDWDDLVRLAEKEKQEDERLATLEDVRITREAAAEDLQEALEGDIEINAEIEIKQEVILDPNE
jgi:hypothetical protein